VRVPRPAGSSAARVREVTRARLLAAATEVFLDRGYHAASVEVIAAAAGFTTGAVYSNFGGKAELFLAVLEDTAAAHLAAVRKALDEARTDEQRLAVFTTVIVRDTERWNARVTATMEFLSHAHQHPELHARILAVQVSGDRAGAELLTAFCQAIGVEPPAELEELTLQVFALLNGLSLRAMFDDTLDLPRAVAAGINALVTGERSATWKVPHASRS
jgi:AcrR family transcriptional regulator